jgi:small-conductance mechanosensitive channel
VILEAVRGNRDVLAEPPPSVFFAEFGASSLDFEVRALVDSFDTRPRVEPPGAAGGAVPSPARTRRIPGAVA